MIFIPGAILILGMLFHDEAVNECVTEMQELFPHRGSVDGLRDLCMIHENNVGGTPSYQLFLKSRVENQ